MVGSRFEPATFRFPNLPEREVEALRIRPPWLVHQDRFSGNICVLPPGKKLRRLMEERGEHSLKPEGICETMTQYAAVKPSAIDVWSHMRRQITGPATRSCVKPLMKPGMKPWLIWCGDICSVWTRSEPFCLATMSNSVMMPEMQSCVKPCLIIYWNQG